MDTRKEVRKLGDWIENETGGRVALTTYSPGDGATRYRLGVNDSYPDHDYFGDRDLVTALGAAEAHVMLRAYMAALNRR